MRVVGFVSVLTVASTLLAAGAAAQQPQETAPAKPAQQQPSDPAKPDLSGIAAPVDPHTYVIGAQDVLQIRVWREPDLSGSFMVRPDGKITLALVGDIQAAGLTPAQLTAKATEALGKIINSPEVMVSVMSVQSKIYYISGNVGGAGPHPLVMPTTVLQALSAASLGPWAKKNKIVIMRGTERIKFNYNEVIKGKKLEQNIFLQDGDHIYVP